MTWVNSGAYGCFFLCCVSSHVFAIVTGEALYVLIKNEVTDRLIQHQPYLLPDSIRIEIQNGDAILALHPQAVTANIDWVGGKHQLLGRSVFPIRLLDSTGMQLGRYGAVTVVSAKAPLLETMRLLVQGAVVVSSDLHVRISDAQAQPSAALRSLSDVVGREVVRTLPVATILAESMVREIPDVRRGSLLTGVLVRGELRFELKGEALSDAKIGQKIKIRLQVGSRRVVEGQVVDAKTVHLD